MGEKLLYNNWPQTPNLCITVYVFFSVYLLETNKSLSTAMIHVNNNVKFIKLVNDTRYYN